MSENLKLGMESLWYGINLWISCLVFLLPLRRKTHFKVRLILSGAVCVLILSGVYYLIENLTDWSYWGQVPLLFITYFSAVLIFYNCVKGKGFDLWYCGVWGNDDIFAGTGNQLCTLQSTAGRFGKLAFENFIFGGSKCGHRTDTGSLDAGKGGNIRLARDRWFLHGCFVLCQKICLFTQRSIRGLLYSTLCCSFIVSPYCICKVHCLKRAV